ncbi:MAG: hypothetical protein KGQ52_07475 [Alphaproteobacteria bacterium]|nr:hypothetical protein [Alphaproteobacteria bacterium]
MLRLDVRFLHREGYLAGSRAATIYWSVNGQRTSDIRIATSEGERPSELLLIYKVRASGADWNSVREAVRLEWQPCHYGGYRPWLTCPRCSRRVGVLWGGERFLCRHCHRVAYPSQNESRLDRHCEQSRKLRRRLGPHLDDLEWPADMLPRPKGMHRSTHRRLVERIAAHDIEIEADLAASIGRLMF